MTGERSTGRLERFDEYVDRCLYDPESGFYARHGEAGRRGDFITSPEVGPLFGAVVARYLDDVWAGLGRPERFTVVEAGAGRGALAQSILTAAPDCSEALHYVTVERSARLRSAQAELLGERVLIASSLEEAGRVVDGVVIANELLDNLAFRLLAVVDGRWAEVWASEDGPVVQPVDDAASMGPLPEAPEGAMLPVIDAAAAWVTEALDLVGRGRLLVVDYGVGSTADLIGREWLRTYRGHDRGADPFETPGRIDITIDVPFDQLPGSPSVVTQAEFLHRFGIDELVEEGRQVWQERAHLGDLAALRARSRVREAEALLDGAGLGAFLVAEWRRG